jgi:hypothetical protein
VSRLDCATVLVTGYVSPASYAAKETQVTLNLLNGTVNSPCGGAFTSAEASTTVQMRWALHLYSGSQACTKMPALVRASLAGTNSH